MHKTVVLCNKHVPIAMALMIVGMVQMEVWVVEDDR